VTLWRLYDAEVVRVIDGDTVELRVDLGFDSWHKGSFRIYGINAREHDAPGGAEAVENLRKLLPVGSIVGIHSIKPDKFGGRYDAIVTLKEGGVLADTLVEQSWAAPWDGKGTKPLPPWPRP
jgi:micrococcal nuclease